MIVSAILWVLMLLASMPDAWELRCQFEVRCTGDGPASTCAGKRTCR